MIKVNEENAQKNKDLSLALSQFLKLLYVDFGIHKLNDNLSNWYELSWEEFNKELENQSIILSNCLLKDWKDFFQKHKQKVLALKNES